MKLILSRKGFDSSVGRVPSPILPDGRVLSLPIPEKNSPIRYADIKRDGECIAPLVADLTQGRIPPSYGAHLDPDITTGSLPRPTGWRPIFGQTGAAQGHLDNNGVSPGDLFLFFGLFRRTTLRQGKYAFLKESQPVHLIWGWLQIAEILPVGMGNMSGYSWAAYHPHCHGTYEKNNSIYVSAEHLNLDGVGPREVGGAGIFPQFSRTRQLTAPAALNLSNWKLPQWFFPQNGRTPLTYHGDLERWQKIEGWAELRTAGRGQEFILDCDQYPEAFPWAADLIGRPEIG